MSSEEAEDITPSGATEAPIATRWQSFLKEKSNGAMSAMSLNRPEKWALILEQFAKASGCTPIDVW
jgi:hypothetical protein